MPAHEVWQVDVQAEASRLDEHLARLSAVEHAQAQRFRKEEDRMRFTIARGSLRDLLSGLLGCGCSQVVFTLGPYAKPMLAEQSAIHFNTSHSGRWILHAVSDVPVGIDIEKICESMARIEDFRQVLSPAEVSGIAEIPREKRAVAVATAWVRKEAYAKALGEGLSHPLHLITTGIGPDGRPALIADSDLPFAPRPWCFRDLDIDSGYRACLVHAGPLRPVRLRSYHWCSSTLRASSGG
jgi:4'-phosphopantetheinyl transferase